MSEKPLHKKTWQKVLVPADQGQAKEQLGFLPQVLAICLVTLLCLGAMEAFFRITGWGNLDPDASVLYYQQIKYPLFQPVELANGQKVYRAVDGRLGPQQFPFKKDPKTFRVFVFGGSATNGLGFSPNATFSNYLQEYLRQIYPTVRFEVLNVGVIGFSSKQVKGMVAHVEENYEPDLLVIYSGNNEFLELHARMFMDRKLNAQVLQVQDFLNRFHAYRGLKAGIRRLQAGGKPGEKRSDEKFARFAFSESELMADIEITPAEYKFILKKYRKNIGEMIAHSGNIPLILMTVSSNLHWNDPDDMQVNWLENYLQDHGVSISKIKRDSFTDQNILALNFLNEELKNIHKSNHNGFQMEIDQIYYRIGKVHENLGNYVRAKEAYEKARDFDKRSRRSLGAFNHEILKFGKELAPEHPNFSVIDSEQFLSERSTHGIIGFDDFYDYVHFTPLGAQRVAEAISRRIVTQRLVPQKIPGIPPAKPFDYLKHQKHYAQELQQREIDFPRADRWLGFNFDKGEITSVNLFKYREGIESLEKMVKLGRNDPWIFTFLGNAYFHKLNHEKEAMNYYRQGLRLLNARERDLRLAILENMAQLYERQGDLKEGHRARTLARLLQSPQSPAPEVALDKYLKFQ